MPALARRRPEAPGRHVHEAEPHGGDRAPRRRHLVGRHLLEILVLQDLAVGHGEGRLDLDLRRLVLALGRFALARLQGVLQAAAELLLCSGSAGTQTCGSSISIIFSRSRGLRQ